jgi:mono/diheme cytochrome c family protein
MVMLGLKSSLGFAADGQALFNENCAMCHQPGGVGSPGLAPPLKDKVLWDQLGHDATQYIVGVMLGGLSGSLEVDGVPYEGLIMPSQGRMTDEELSAIANYVLVTLNSSGEKVSPGTVADLRANPPTHAKLRALRKTKNSP